MKTGEISGKEREPEMSSPSAWLHIVLIQLSALNGRLEN